MLYNGAIATVSASRVSWYGVGSWGTGLKYYCDNASIGFYYGNELVGNNKVAAVALFDVKSDMGANGAWWGNVSWMNLFDFNLFGDPTTSLTNQGIAHIVTSPDTPSGPSTGTVNNSYSYATAGSACSLGHSVEYRFDWGDGSYSTWSSSTSANKSWISTGIYTVRSQARCSFDQNIVSGWSSGRTVNISLPAAVISGAVKTKEGKGIGKVTITFSNGGGTTSTNSSGNYSHGVGLGRSGTVTPSKTGVTFAPSSRNYTSVTSDQANQDYVVHFVTSSLKYQGIVAQDIGDGDTNHELICDFGNLGVYVYDLSSGWHKISPDNPDWIIKIRFGGGSSGILADFGSMGLWWWKYSGYPGTWTRISNDNATIGYAVDDDGDGKDEAQLSFGTLGVWRYDGAPKWHKITGDTPLDLRAVRFVGASDYELVSTFQGVPGLWMWDYVGWLWNWIQLTAQSPDWNDGFVEPFDPNALIETSGDEVSRPMALPPV